MKGILVDHGGGAGKPGEPLGFIAKMNKTGRQIVISLKNGDKIPKVITLTKDDPAISGFCPTPGGRAIYCLMDDGTDRWFATATGQPLIGKTKGLRKRKLRQ